MGLAGADAPSDITFVGARRLHSSGATLQLNTIAAATWVRQPGITKSFLSKMGGMCVARSHPHLVAVEYVPILFDPLSMGALTGTKQNSGLPSLSILDAKYIKRAHLRSPGQSTAHVILGIATHHAANHAIEHGLFIEGKHVSVQKMLCEPTHCLKCQTVGVQHVAADCKSIHDTCARCSGLHHTSNCTITDTRHFHCANCQTDGHGAADRHCPAFLAQVQQMQEWTPENKYQFFPTNDPRSWESSKPETLYTNTQDLTWQDKGAWKGGWTQPRADRQRKGRGRLAGGPPGAGSGDSPRTGGPTNGRQTDGNGTESGQTGHERQGMARLRDEASREAGNQSKKTNGRGKEKENTTTDDPTEAQSHPPHPEPTYKPAKPH